MPDLLLILLLAGHLLAVNIASAGPLLSIGLDRRSARGDDSAARAGCWLAKMSIIALLVGIVHGLLMGCLLWSSDYQSLLARLISKIHFGGWEILFSLGLMTWNWRLWCDPLKRGRTKLRTCLAVLAGTNLLYHFPFLMTVIARLSNEGKFHGEPITSAMFRRLMIEPQVLAQTLHVWLASFAVSGVFLFLCPAEKNETDDTGNRRVVMLGASWALGATLLQIPVGIWLLTTLPALAQEKMLGSDLVASTLFFISIITAVWLLHLLSSILFGDTSRAARRKTIIAIVATVIAMTGALQRLQIRSVSKGWSGDRQASDSLASRTCSSAQKDRR